jgi:hypothetical protein
MGVEVADNIIEFLIPIFLVINIPKIGPRIYARDAAELINPNVLSLIFT